MYAESKVLERIALAEQTFHVTLTYHTVEEVEEFERSLHRENKYLFGELGQPVGTQNLTESDRTWMLNEQLLVLCDAAYFLTRYAFLRSEDGVIQRFRFRVPQRIYFDIVCDLESRDAAIEIMILKARQLGMCLDSDTKVLTSKLEWKRIRHVEVGDELISVDENPAGGKGQHRRMRKAIVEAKREVTAPTIRMTLADGRTTYATPEHRFLCKVRGSVSTVWRTVGEMRIGDEIRWITYPWTEPTYEDGWFGGLLDGEGSLRPKSRAGSELCISQVSGPVLERARKYLDDHGYTYREEIDDRKAGASSKLGNKPVHKFTIGRMDEIFRLLGQTRPTRLLAKSWWEGKELPGKKSGTGWVEVKSLESLPARTMIDLQTSTRTFIAEGLVSHNSIFTELLIAHRTIFSYGVSSVIGSADQTKTGEMSRMLLLCYDMLPVWLRPQHTSRVESDRGKMLFGSMASGVSFQHGSQKFGIATGSTPTIYHLSEVALYGEASVMLIDEGLWKAVHASTNVLGVLESTGRSNKGWWAETWYYSKKEWPRCRMYPMFLPWFCGVDIYPKPAWMKIRPIPSDWYPNRDTRNHVAKAELFVHSSPLLHKHLLAEQDRRAIPHTDRWRMPYEQQWFWEVNHDEAKTKGNESSFLQEMAGDDEEALQHSTESVFGHHAIQVINERRERHYTCYGLSGQSIEDAHEPPHEDINYDAERIPIRMTSQKGETYRWELIPLRFHAPLRENNMDDAVGKLIVFHEPRPGIRYSMGIDTSEGKGADSTVISVWGLGEKTQPDFQAAEFASCFVSHVEAYAFGACIGAYYSKYMSSESTKWPMPYVACEQVQAVGDTCQLQMMRMGYPMRCFHKMTRYDGKPSDIARRRRQKGGKMGWFTWGWSRPILTGNFVSSAQNGWAAINSPWLIEEMKEFEVHVTATGKERLEHEEGGHDDRIFAAAMAIFCPHDMDVLAERSKKRLPDFASSLPAVDIAPYTGQIVHSVDLRNTRTLTLQDMIYGDTSSLRRDSY